MATASTYEAGALSAWTPAQQAALNHLQYVKQKERDLEEWGKAEEKKKKGEKEDEAKQVKERAGKVEAGKVIDELIVSWCPPLSQVLEVFGPPHAAILAYLGAHLAFYYYAPWYWKYLITYPSIYIIPLYCGITSLLKIQDRFLWLVYFMILGIMEQFEVLVLHDRARVVLIWPKLKAILCVALYSPVAFEHKTNRPIYGAIRLIQRLLPPPMSPEAAPSDKKKDSGRSADKDKKRKDAERQKRDK